MSYYSVKTTKNKQKFILQLSSIKPPDLSNPKPQTEKTPRSLSQPGSLNYQRALRRAFARSKLLAFFNPDMLFFSTMTFADNITDVDYALKQVKLFMKQNQRNTNKKLKYIYIFELQKRGAIHIHMISNENLDIRINKYGYRELVAWRHGYTNVQTIDNVDGDFKPYLYLFKYMKKSVRVGKSFIHTSRGFDDIIDYDYEKYIGTLEIGHELFREDYELFVNNVHHRIQKKYRSLSM